MDVWEKGVIEGGIIWYGEDVGQEVGEMVGLTGIFG